MYLMALLVSNSHSLLGTKQADSGFPPSSNPFSILEQLQNYTIVQDISRGMHHPHSKLINIFGIV